jgi:hypothetical protein
MQKSWIFISNVIWQCLLNITMKKRKKDFKMITRIAIVLTLEIVLSLKKELRIIFSLWENYSKKMGQNIPIIIVFLKIKRRTGLIKQQLMYLPANRCS